MATQESIEALKKRLFSSITFEMDQAGYRAFSGFGEGWSDLEESLRRVLVEMLVAADKQSIQAICETLQSILKHAESAEQSKKLR